MTLASSNAAVTVPATVVVPANATSAGFTATVSIRYELASGGPDGECGPRFQELCSAAECRSTHVGGSRLVSHRQCDVEHGLDASSDADLDGDGAGDYNSATLSGTGFTMSGATFPVTLNPSLAITLDVQFDPAATGAVTGQLTIQSNSSTNGTAVISLSGTGIPHQVDLSWQAPRGSTDPAQDIRFIDQLVTALRTNC